MKNTKIITVSLAAALAIGAITANGVPFSYTHLDVYKRQLQDISERFIKNIVLQRISIAANIVDASIWFKTNYA